MSDGKELDKVSIDAVREELSKEGEPSGYFLNPDAMFTGDLVQGLLINEKRYGYRACPCRLASGNKMEDLDIICPCDYRDLDLAQYGACYCALYVSQAVFKGEKTLTSVPERRSAPDAGQEPEDEAAKERRCVPPLPVWRCRVCGYLCGREGPPEICPICKAGKERFERFM
jgi:ferredoxin-thioredoxin reductase catalytic chain